MFIYNFKLNGSKIFKILLGIIIFVVILLCILAISKVYNASVKSGDCSNPSNMSTLTTKNYTNVLKSVHDDVDTYVGQKIKFSGYVYRVYDLNNEQFILARNMIISSDFQSVIVGFLCHYKDSISLCDASWVEIEGTITKGIYHNSPIPILEINSIKNISKPEDEYVYPPDDTYIPTSVI